jgi:predicted phage gp36 major capsid-like protein
VARSRVTNGKSLFDTDVDGRSSWVRRLRDLVAVYTEDIGGHDLTTERERSIIRRISALTTEVELLEKRFALANTGASAVDLDLYLRAGNSLRKWLGMLGGERRAKDITPINELIQQLDRAENNEAAE